MLPGILVAYKRLIDDGLAGSLGQALALERERARAWAASLEGAEIERRRTEIQSRGKRQSAPPPSLQPRGPQTP